MKKLLILLLFVLSLTASVSACSQKRTITVVKQCSSSTRVVQVRSMDTSGGKETVAVYYAIEMHTCSDMCRWRETYTANSKEDAIEVCMR